MAGGDNAPNWIRSVERYAFPRIGRRPVCEVNTADVLEIVTPIWHSGGNGEGDPPARPRRAGVGGRAGPAQRQSVRPGGAGARPAERHRDAPADELASYEGLDATYAHGVINHAVKYVGENVHTNTMENFWSLLKRALGGTYVSVEPFHLFRYLDEQAYRWNERWGNDLNRFTRALARVFGRRVTYRKLTGQEHDVGYRSDALTCHRSTRSGGVGTGNRAVPVPLDDHGAGEIQNSAIVRPPRRMTQLRTSPPRYPRG